MASRRAASYCGQSSRLEGQEARSQPRAWAAVQQLDTRGFSNQQPRVGALERRGRCGHVAGPVLGTGSAGKAPGQPPNVTRDGDCRKWATGVPRPGRGPRDLRGPLPASEAWLDGSGARQRWTGLLGAGQGPGRGPEDRGRGGQVPPSRTRAPSGPDTVFLSVQKPPGPGGRVSLRLPLPARGPRSWWRPQAKSQFKSGRTDGLGAPRGT